MKQMSELLETGVYEYYQPPKTTTVKDIIELLGLEGMHFGVLLDGKTLDLNTEVTPDDKLVIIPQIKGGSPIPTEAPKIAIPPKKEQFREQKLYRTDFQNNYFAGFIQTPKKHVANRLEKLLDTFVKQLRARDNI